MQQFTTDDGEQISLKISGEGPPLILLHGWTADHRDWYPFVGELGKTHRIYRWDARGHGLHLRQTSTPCTVERMATDLANLIAHYDLRDATIVGHSMGALTLWQYIELFGTGRIAKLCVIDQSPKLLNDATWSNGIYSRFDQRKMRTFRALLEEDFAEGVLQLVAFGHNEQARIDYEENSVGFQRYRTHLAGLNANALITCWNSLTAADFRPTLPKIDRPTLLVYGAESNFYDRKTAEYVAEHIPGAKLVVYENADHSPHLAQRDRFMTDLLTF